jgi:hypothetical protein
MPSPSLFPALPPPALTVNKTGIPCVDFPTLILAAFGLHIVVGESVAFAVDIVDVHKTGLVVCRILGEEGF